MTEVFVEQPLASPVSAKKSSVNKEAFAEANLYVSQLVRNVCNIGVLDGLIREIEMQIVVI